MTKMQPLEDDSADHQQCPFELSIRLLPAATAAPMAAPSTSSSSLRTQRHGQPSPRGGSHGDVSAMVVDLQLYGGDKSSAYGHEVDGGLGYRFQSQGGAGEEGFDNEYGCGVGRGKNSGSSSYYSCNSTLVSTASPPLNMNANTFDTMANHDLEAARVGGTGQKNENSTSGSDWCRRLMMGKDSTSTWLVTTTTTTNSANHLIVATTNAENRNSSYKYIRYSAEQVEALEALYNDCPKPSSARRQQLISDHPLLRSIHPKQVKVWFQNRREKQKKETTRLQAVNARLTAMNKLLIEENERLQQSVEQLISDNAYLHHHHLHLTLPPSSLALPAAAPDPPPLPSLLSTLPASLQRSPLS